MPEKQTEKRTSRVKNVLRYSGMTFQIAAYIAVGVFIGGKVDAYFSTSEPYFTALFSIILLVSGLYVTLKDLFKS